MAIARLADYPDLTQDDYRKVIDLLGYATSPPKGQILHVASVTNDNVGRIFDIYESEMLFRDFEKNKLFPTLDRVGMRSVQSNTYPLHNVQLIDQNLLKDAVSRSAVALLVVPAIGLLAGSWVGFPIGATMYLASRRFSPAEERKLADAFGAKWDEYEKKVWLGWL